MASLTWMRCLACWIFLCSPLQFQATNGNTTIPELQLLASKTKHYNCTCTNRKGQVYNLTKLEKHFMKPRFNTSAPDQYWFSYNPCLSFTLGGPIGDCSDDVAICMWTPTSYQNIGLQSSFRCGFHGDIPYLIYDNEGKLPGWEAIIILTCDPQKIKANSAEFTVKTDLTSPRIFNLTHSCACADVCRYQPVTTAATELSTRPSGTTAPDGWKKTWFPVCISAGSVAFVIVAFFFIFRLIDRRHPPEEVQPLVAGSRSSNEEYFTPPSSMTTAGSSSEITVRHVLGEAS